MSWCFKNQKKPQNELFSFHVIKLKTRSIGLFLNSIIWLFGYIRVLGDTSLTFKAHMKTK